MCSFRDRLDHVLNCCIPSLHILLFLHDVLHNESRKFIRIGRQGAIWILPSSVRDNIIIPPHFAQIFGVTSKVWTYNVRWQQCFIHLAKFPIRNRFPDFPFLSPSRYGIWSTVHFKTYTDNIISMCIRIMAPAVFTRYLMSFHCYCQPRSTPSSRHRPRCRAVFFQGRSFLSFPPWQVEASVSSSSSLRVCNFH